MSDDPMKKKRSSNSLRRRTQQRGNSICQKGNGTSAHGFGPENVGLIFPMIASHLKTG